MNAYSFSIFKRADRSCYSVSFKCCVKVYRKIIKLEISVQQETERIEGLSDEKKTEGNNTKLHVLAREAIMKAEEAELLGETFDKNNGLLPRKIEKMYT